MNRRRSGPLRSRTLQQLTIGDERSFTHVALYADLKAVLRRARYSFRILPRAYASRADRALLLNLTYWSADAGGDVLATEHIEADVVAHAAWHHLASRAMPAKRGERPSAAALLLGESIASAFDVYLIGRLLGRAPRSTFLASQTLAMAEVTAAAGMTSRAFERMLAGLAADPEGSFAELRSLLYDATLALLSASDANAAQASMASLDAHRLAALLPRYELSNWVLYCRAFARLGADARVTSVDRALRGKDPLGWLEGHWVAPALARRAAKAG